jgi:hypothetical protein
MTKHKVTVEWNQGANGHWHSTFLVDGMPSSFFGATCVASEDEVHAIADASLARAKAQA